MSILIGLLPALAWGLMPLFVAKIGGKPSNQIFGTTAGTFAVALLSLIFYHPEVYPKVFLLSLLSGALWVVGQLGQYTAFTMLGVSRTMPISTGLQLLGTTLIGVLIFHEWKGSTAEIVGFSALALVIAGIYLTTIKDKNAGGAFNTKALLLLFLTNFGYLAYTSIPEIVGKAGMAIFFPQALGMLLASAGYVLFTGKAAVFKEKVTWKNMIPGFLFAIAALSYIVSAQRNGIATGFVLSQLSVVISTLGAIFILKEHKTRIELIATIIGLVLIVIGSSATAMIR